MTRSFLKLAAFCALSVAALHCGGAKPTKVTGPAPEYEEPFAAPASTPSPKSTPAPLSTPAPASTPAPKSTSPEGALIVPAG